MAQLFHLAVPDLGIRNRHRRDPIPPRQGVLEILEILEIEVLGGGMSGRFFTEIREKRGKYRTPSVQNARRLPLTRNGFR